MCGGQDNIDQAARSTADPPFESGAIWQVNDVLEPEAENTTAALMITAAEEDKLARETCMVNFSWFMAGRTTKQGIATHGSTESEILGVAE